MNIPEQSGFDFGTSNLASDVFSVFDLSDFPNVSEEEVIRHIGSTVNYGLKVHDIATGIWELVLNDEIVSELRDSQDFEPATLDKISIALGEPLDSIQLISDSALTSLRNKLESVSVGVAA